MDSFDSLLRTTMGTLPTLVCTVFVSMVATPTSFRSDYCSELNMQQSHLLLARAIVYENVFSNPSLVSFSNSVLYRLALVQVYTSPNTDLTTVLCTHACIDTISEQVCLLLMDSCSHILGALI